MTRGKAHNNVRAWINEDTEKDRGTYHYGKVELHRDINRVYDSFESRTCENCKHISEVHPTECTHTANYTFDWMEVPKGFSCNRWEAK